MTWAALACGVCLWAAPAGADHTKDFHLGKTAPESEPPPRLLRYAPDLAEWLRSSPPFFRDTQLNVHLRTFYFNLQQDDFTANEAWAAGGWLEYTSGWLGDVVRLGAVGYTSQPLYAPDARDGTGLLGAGQRSLLVMGQAYAQLRYRHYARLTGYRQQVNQGYTNPQDNRMIPNTFEGATVGGTVGPLSYYLGYLTAMKARSSDEFVNMAQAAGVSRHNRGQLVTSLTLAPLEGLDLYLANYLVADVFNTVYVNPELTFRLTDAWSGRVGLQLTDQRSVGARFLGDFATWNVGAHAQFHWRGLSFIGATSFTGDGAALRTPYGAWPGYLSLIELDFDRAGEKAWGVGVGYDWGGRAFPGALIPGLSTLLFYAHGVGARDPATGASLPNRQEVDLDIIWRSRFIKGLQYRFRNAYADTGGKRALREFRIVVDYELPIL